jgi:ABC-2 type transport system ATP-binding protein
MEVLEINSIRKEFGTVVAVNNVSFSVDKGQVLGLIGPNGAGKTTLLRILATVLRPTSGSVRLLGYDLAKDYLQIRKYIGFMPDFFNLYNDLTLSECLEFFAKAYNVEQDLIPKRIDEILEYVDLEDKRKAFIRHLSRGMVQRMGVAVLLIHEPELLLLDEPASGLDPKARIQLRNVLKKISTEGKTIIISSHILTELSGFCSHIAIMDEGNIKLHGAVDEIQQKIAGATKVNISVLDDCERAVALIEQFPDAELITAQYNKITVEVNKGPEVLAGLNAYLVNQGIKVVSFSEQKADLEDLFMKISSGE